MDLIHKAVGALWGKCFLEPGEDTLCVGTRWFHGEDDARSLAPSWNLRSIRPPPVQDQFREVRGDRVVESLGIEDAQESLVLRNFLPDAHDKACALVQGWDLLQAPDVR